MRKIFVSNNAEDEGNIENIKYIASGYYEEKKSKFYSYIFNISSKEEAIKIIYKAKESFKDARHVVYAYVLENEFYYSDDGEPSGTAGKMIYSLMEKQNVTNALIIVVRYFGGILLGVGPLSRAYLKSVKEAEEKLHLEQYVPRKEITIECEYKDEPNLRNIISKTKSTILNVIRKENVVYLISVDENYQKEYNIFKK